MQNIPNFNDVNVMRKEGLSDTKIVKSLQNQGFTKTQTYDTMRQADLTQSGANNIIKDSYQNPKESNNSDTIKNKMINADMPSPSKASTGAPTMPPPSATPQDNPTNSVPNTNSSTIPPPSMPPPPVAGAQNISSSSMPSPSGMNTGSSIEEIEEVVETIIDERWKEVTESIKKVIDWKNLMDQRFERMDQEVKDLKTNFNELYKAIVGKIGDYDHNLLKVGAEMKAMEKVFSKVLPTFTENVNDLARVAEDIRAFAVNEKMTKPK